MRCIQWLVGAAAVLLWGKEHQQGALARSLFVLPWSKCCSPYGSTQFCFTSVGRVQTNRHEQLKVAPCHLGIRVEIWHIAKSCRACSLSTPELFFTHSTHPKRLFLPPPHLLPCPQIAELAKFSQCRGPALCFCELVHVHASAHLAPRMAQKCLMASLQLSQANTSN